MAHRGWSLREGGHPVPERKGSQNPKQTPDTEGSAQTLPGMFRGIGDTEWEVPRSPRASAPGAARPGPPRPGLLAMAHYG